MRLAKGRVDLGKEGGPPMVCVVWTEKRKQVQKSINVVSAKGFSPAAISPRITREHVVLFWPGNSSCGN